MTIKLLFFAGSQRKESWNKKLAKAAYNIAKKQDHVEATYLDLADYDMPIYNQDLEEESGLPDKAIALKNQFIDCDGFFIASPEYNSAYTPLLKNSLDWISRKSDETEPMLIAYQGKIAALSAASPGGYGGLRGLIPLRMMLGNIGVHVLPNQMALSQCHEHFDQDHNINKKQYQDMLEKLVQDLVETTSALKVA